MGDRPEGAERASLGSRACICGRPGAVVCCERGGRDTRRPAFTSVQWVACLLLAAPIEIGCLPLRVSTGVRVGEPTEPFTLKLDRPAPKRHVLLLLFKSGVTDERRHDLTHGAETVWEAMAERGGHAECQVGENWLRAVYGESPEVVARNLDALVRVSGGAWRKKVEGGYIVSFGKAAAESLDFKAADARFPVLTILSPDLDHSCRFLSCLTGRELVISARNPVRAVERPERYLHGYSSRAQLHLENLEPTTFAELAACLAAFHGCVTRRQGETVMIADPTPEDVRARIADMMEACRRKEEPRLSDSAIYGLPRGSARELAKYLNAPDKYVVRKALSILLELDKGVGREELLSLLRKGEEGHLDEYTMDLVVKNLALVGAEEALPHLEESARFCFTERLLFLAGRVHTQRGAETQARMLARLRPLFRAVKPGRVEVKSRPADISDEEIRKVERLAVDFVNGCLDPDKDEEAHAMLTFSRDGRCATYRLHIGYDWGPERSGWTIYVVELRKQGAWWFIVGGRLAGCWQS